MPNRPVNTFKPKSLEEIVVYDKDFQRVKIKNKIEIISFKRNIVKSILNGTIDDVYTIVSEENKQIIKDIQIIIQNFLIKSENQFADWVVQSDNDKKIFASFVNASETPIANAFFTTFNKKYNSISESLLNTTLTRRTLDNIISYLNI